jgi:F0F1-type ATP synthase assembly protein I
MSPKPQDEASGWQRALKDSAPFLGIGSSLAATVLICVWGGHWLDERYGTAPRYFLIGAVLGLAAAFYHFYKMYKAMTGAGKR